MAIRAKRLRALLAILLLNTSQVVPIDRIIEGIWPDQPPRSALENVRTYVSQLRHLLCLANDRERLQSHPGGYRLLADPEELDLLRFTTLAADGRQALHAGDHSGAAVLLGEAIDLWRGAPLPELELGPTIRAKTVALEEQRWQVQVDWITARLALGEHAEVVAVLRELIGERSLDERLWCCLVTALYGMGRTGEALSAVAEARQVFVTELGIEPGPELRRVQAAVLGGEEIQGSPKLGAAPGTSGTPHQLPAGGTGFVGRGEERDRVRELVENHQHQVILFSGPPGVGKTASAIAVSTQIADGFPDGQLYVDLRGSSGMPLDPADAVGTLLGGLGVTPEAMPDNAERRTTLYRTLLAERRMLVLLDDAADTAQVMPLLPGPGNSLVMMTSRRWLAGVEAAAHLHLEPLRHEDALAMLAGVIGQRRVDDEPAYAAQIVEACGRLPAAIRIIAARLAARPRHSLRVLAERLSVPDQVLDELTVDGLSIRRLFEVSYQTLAPRTRACFRMLSQFDPQHVTAGGLGELLHVPVHEADRELERLLHEGLLSPGSTDDGVPNYHMPVVLHTFAHERFTAEGTVLRSVTGINRGRGRARTSAKPRIDRRLIDTERRGRMNAEQEICHLIENLLASQGRADEHLVVTPQTSLADDGLALTSLELVRLLVSLEERMDVELDDVAIMNASFDNVGDILALVGASRTPTGRAG
ncbi:BTAD domain-containing putative transcriptional regulator [Kibdelosporangium persicum]|uniref:DNA-binding transcriptional activator of the SARP family n=1 Tax=Kibdelosporangium persicum TaxID=2698649 RepID=A0ABX2FF23_9PSEU|nr:BTAD domain-containing putative transcriptional regulator [Kibdelosporangium persicum]NRN69421.1 DNA-binding transcriptional activator of the SARP family [Kibdelosporangium persicum]